MPSSATRNRRNTSAAFRFHLKLLTSNNPKVELKAPPTHAQDDMSNLSAQRHARPNNLLHTPASHALPHHHNPPPQRNTHIRQHRNAIRRPSRRLDFLAHPANCDFHIRRPALQRAVNTSRKSGFESHGSGGREEEGCPAGEKQYTSWTTTEGVEFPERQAGSCCAG